MSRRNARGVAGGKWLQVLDTPKDQPTTPPTEVFSLVSRMTDKDEAPPPPRTYYKVPKLSGWYLPELADVYAGPLKQQRNAEWWTRWTVTR